MNELLVVVIDSASVRDERDDGLVEQLTSHGFELLQRKKLILSPPQLSSLFADSDAPGYAEYPVVCLLLRREDAYYEFRTMGLEGCTASSDRLQALQHKHSFFPDETHLERVLAVMLPGHQAMDVDAVMDVVEAHDFVVLRRQTMVLSEEQATPLFTNRDDPEARIGFCTSGECCVLVLEKIDALFQWNDLIGHDDPEVAKRLKPDSLRATFGESKLKNFLFTTLSNTETTHAIAAIFPEPQPFPLQRTLAMIKPAAVANGHVDEVLAEIRYNGFTVLAREHTRLSHERAQEFYAEHSAKPFFGNLCDFMSSGPIVALVLCKPGAISHWRKLLGPTNSDTARQRKPVSIRARFGTDGTKNACHGSDSEPSATREIQFFFPNLRADSFPTAPDKVQEFMHLEPLPGTRLGEGSHAATLSDVLLQGLTALCRAKPGSGLDAVEYLGQWLLDVQTLPKPTGRTFSTYGRF